MRRSALTVLAAVAGVSALAACDSERAIATETVGDPAYGIKLSQSGTNTPRGTVVFSVTGAGSRDSVRLTLRGLDSLAGTARYVLWVTDSTRSTFRRLSSRIVMTVVDTATNAQGDPEEVPRTTTFLNTSAFSNGGPNRRFDITAAMPSEFAAGVRPDLVLVTIEASDAAAEPNPARRPLWAQRTAYTSANTPAANAGQVSFGFWSADATEQYVYPLGTARGRAYFRGDVLMVNDSSLPRPPRGYFYATYLIKRDNLNQATDTVYLGPQTAPAPRRDLSLRHADSVVVDPLVQVERSILAASSRVSADSTGGLDINVPFSGVADVLVTLELKDYKVDEARMGPAILLRADVPSIVRVGPQ
jgi:hypothetical protein